MPIRLWRLAIPTFREFVASEKSLNLKQKMAEETPDSTQFSIPKPPKFIDWKEAVEKLKVIEGKFKEAISAAKSPDTLPAMAFYLALRGEIEVLNYLNNDKINCLVPWDEQIGLPSLATLSADAGKFGDLFEASNAMAAVLKSFSAWSFFFQETLKDCTCGNSRARDVLLSRFLNHSVRADGDSLSVKQMLAITSNDKKHMRHHYSGFTKPSQWHNDMLIIWSCENRVTLANGSVTIEPKKEENSMEFKMDGLKNYIFELISEFENKDSKVYNLS